VTYYTPEEMARLNAEYARVAKIMKESDIAAQKARMEWNEQQRKIKNIMDALEQEKAAKRAARAAEAKKYWAYREGINARIRAKLAAKLEDGRTRERISRINWLEVFGDRTLANRQVAWERRATALRMRKLGKKYSEIGKRLDVCRGRAQQMVAHAEHERKHSKHRSPAEIWMTEHKVNPDQKLRRFSREIVVMPPHDPETDWIWMGLAA